jgi:ABC-type phosphate transport system substrate-binding protein
MNTLAQRFVRSVCVLLVLSQAATAPSGYAQSSITVVATESSLPESLYVAWGDEYHKLHQSVQLRYLPEGTGSSGQKILAGVGDMGAETLPITASGVGCKHPAILGNANVFRR